MIQSMESRRYSDTDRLGAGAQESAVRRGPPVLRVGQGREVGQGQQEGKRHMSRLAVGTH